MEIQFQTSLFGVLLNSQNLFSKKGVKPEPYSRNTGPTSFLFPKSRIAKYRHLKSTGVYT